MRVRVYFNDANGGSFSPKSQHYAVSDERRHYGNYAHHALDGDRPYMPMLDGYDADKVVLVESMLSPMSVEADSPQAACEAAFRLLNADDRLNGQHERSLSVGDVVEVNGERYSVENIGFRLVEPASETVSE